ncbi:hypothetical protein C464_10353 [Halorubrum coriense DSM 10284]|uniref:Uncharacterized protein n=1 Tax=Halorubrum coriense DSM 10284 TaxID=1227466 RepID=M0EG79_9EURY|nr:hypothetical protein [Halorubrum coriense]ELZ46770.1 hypothetical protein C464_10353 [Halorubrum coriense DSM 10284]
MPSEIVDHSTRVIAIQIGFWLIALAVGASAVGYRVSVTAAGAILGATIVASALVLEVAER